MDKDENGVERTCAVTRRKGTPERMIRFVAAPDGRVVPDIRRRLPGRGVWLGGTRVIVEKAVTSKAFTRGFKSKVVVAPDLVAEVEALLDQDALQSLSMANKAGAVTTGFAKVEAALAGGGVAVLLHAIDGGEDGIRKLDAAARRGRDEGRAPASLKLFSSQQLDLALGRTNVIHAALAEGPAGDAFLTRCQRSIHYRTEAGIPPAAHSEADAEGASA